MTTLYIQINQYQYPIGWEWIHDVPVEDWEWLLDVFATTTDDTETYDYGTYIHDGQVTKVDTQGLSKFMNDDQGYEGGIREYGYYIAAKTLGIKSEGEFLNKFDKIREICNRS